MQRVIEWRSLLLGISLGILLVVGVGAVQQDRSEVGRFDIEADGAHAYVIDTATGQIWKQGGTSFYEPKIRHAE